MDTDQKFAKFLEEQAERMGCTFVVDTFDGRESPDLIDGMAVDDVWGWLLPAGVTIPTDEHFGCLIWDIDGGSLRMTWKQRFDR